MAIKEYGEFCKLFETEKYGQLLVMLDTDDEAEVYGPRVQVKMKPPGLGVCAISVGGWADDDNGWRLAEEAFLKTNKEGVEKFAEHVFSIIEGQ